LAENFAGALLMPSAVVRQRWDQRGDVSLRDWLCSVANSLRVTAVALKWRLVVLRLLTEVEARSIADGALASNGRDVADELPLPFDRELIERIHQAIEEGYMSLRRATGILGTTARDFGELCRAYGLTLSYEV
jgi:Zn-dependent peptidase ImmA (M78 family)